MQLKRCSNIQLCNGRKKTYSNAQVVSSIYLKIFEFALQKKERTQKIYLFSKYLEINVSIAYKTIEINPPSYSDS